MRTNVADFELITPRSLADALALLHERGPLRPIAGCTDVFVDVNSGTLKGTRFLNLWPLRGELARIDGRDGAVRIGALATYTELIESPLVRERVPILADAARLVGGVQIQNRGTIGGNIANASPAGDTLPVLAVMDATVVLASARGERRVPFDSFYTGYRASVRRDDELIVAVELRPPRGEQRFRKVGTRAAQAISKVVLAGALGKAPRFAVGSVAPTVIRLKNVEAALAAGASIDDALAKLDDDIRPIDDVRSTAIYRRRVTENVLRDWLAPKRKRRG